MRLEQVSRDTFMKDYLAYIIRCGSLLLSQKTDRIQSSHDSNYQFCKTRDLCDRTHLFSRPTERDTYIPKYLPTHNCHYLRHVSRHTLLSFSFLRICPPTRRTNTIPSLASRTPFKQDEAAFELPCLVEIRRKNIIIAIVQSAAENYLRVKVQQPAIYFPWGGILVVVNSIRKRAWLIAPESSRLINQQLKLSIQL